MAFGGKALAARTDAGTSSMGLTAELFANTDKNFGEVTFSVTDGYVTVEPVDVTVKIKGFRSVSVLILPCRNILFHLLKCIIY